MKIVSFGDVHMAISQMQKIAVELATADLILLSGDLTNFGGRADAKKVVYAAKSYCPHVLALPGNVDKPDVLDFLQAEQISLHCASRQLSGLSIFGCGGSNITPFHTPLEFEDAELEAMLADAYAGVINAPVRLMVCHTPPHATKLDRLANGTPVGSRAVRQFIEQYQPQVCITGHIHESPGVDQIGRTKVFNAGHFGAGGYIVAWYKEGTLDAELRFTS